MIDYYKWRKQLTEPTVNFDNQLENYAKAVQHQRELKEALNRWKTFKETISPSRLDDFAVRVASFVVDCLLTLPVFDGFVLVNLKTKEVKHVFTTGYRERRKGWQIFSNVFDWREHDVTIILLDVNLFFNTVVGDVRDVLENLQTAAKNQ